MRNTQAATTATRARSARARRTAGSFLAVLLLATSLTLTGGVAGPVAIAHADGAFVARGSVNQVYTHGHTAGDAIELWAAGGEAAVQSGVADAQGALLFREVPTGPGYEVRNTTDGTSVGELTVMSPTEHPPFSAYQAIDLGPAVPNGNTYTYLPTRDGTLLSINITFPRDGSPGPWPVVVDYSGYDPSQPPNPPQEAIMFPYIGYVTVGVNLRGTTCSGGAFDIWETLQTLDGYDVIETLAAQPWSTGDVGMVGISFPGISQLFVAQTQPPHLRAITPLSTYADFYGGIGYPGGVINSGFFLDWLKDRDADSMPAAHSWVSKRINELGDTTCAQNQVMHLQAHKVIPEALPGRFYEERGDYLSPKNFVDKIKVPVLLAGQFQDEQTGGQWATMIDEFDPETKLKVHLTNGTHVESLGPEHLGRLLEFVDFYVGKRLPTIPITLRFGAQLFYKDLMGTELGYLPPDRFPQFPGQTFDQALAAYEAEPPVRIWWENGSGPTIHYTAGEPFSSAQGEYASWPLPGTTAVPWYFQPDGKLTATPPTVGDDEPRGYSSYEYDPASKIVDPTFARPTSTFNQATDKMWKPLPAVQWKPLTEGNSVSFVTDPLAKVTTLAGSASADVWVRSTELDTDLEVTLTEVRADGKETYIQSGWLRASRRQLEPSSTELRPVHSHLAADAQPLVPGEFALARVEIYPFAHVLRAGSRLRINVEVPGGNHAFWQIDPMKFGGEVVNDVAHSVGRPSKIVLPIVPAALNPAVPVLRPPACPGLRGQACRDYLPARRPTNVQAVARLTDLDVTWTAPAGPAPDSYRITVSPTNETITVSGAQTSHLYENAAFDTKFAFTVEAVYGDTPAPASNASPLVEISTVTFPDVPEGHPFFTEIEWVAAAGIAAGYEDGTYRPTAPVTRQAMASFLYKLHLQPTVTLTEPFFADVPEGHPFYAAIQWMAQEGLSTGTPQPTGKPRFLPLEPVSRQAMAAFLWRDAGQPATILSSPYFADFTDTESPFYGAVQWMGSSGISQGTPNLPDKPLFVPLSAVSRQAMAAFLMRYAAED